MKRLITLFCAVCALVLSAAAADAKDVKCMSWSGVLDPLGYKLELNVVRRADYTVAGDFTFGNFTYFAYGSKYMQAGDYEFSLEMYDNGSFIGSLEMTFDDEKGTATGQYTVEGRTYDIDMKAKPGATMPDPFEPPTEDELNVFTVYSKHFKGEYNSFDGNIIVVKDINGFSFCALSSIGDNYGPVKDLESGAWDLLPYKDGKLVYKDGTDTFEIYFYRDFIITFSPDASEEAETPAYLLSDFYQKSDDDYTLHKSWMIIEGEGEATSYGDDSMLAVATPDIDYWPNEKYPDVAAIRAHINSRDIDEVDIPVDLDGAERPNILLYFRAVAKAFNCGILGEALNASYGEAEGAGTAFTLDSRNGYIKCVVPDEYGNEGMEMCYWRGKEGKDVVALNLRYIGADENNLYDHGLRYLGVFFRYDPATKKLMALSTNGSDTYSLFKYSEEYDMFPEDGGDVEMPTYYMKLPREGKSIEFLDVVDNINHVCQWNADWQWFEWN